MKVQLTTTEAQILVEKFKANKLTPKDERILYTELESHFKPHKIDNHLYDQEEIKSEFMVAAWNALHRAKTDVGNPILFAARRGYGATLDYYRRVSAQRLLKICTKCGAPHTYDHRRKKCSNPACGGTEFYSIESDEFFTKKHNMSGVDMIEVDYEGIVDLSDLKKKFIKAIKTSAMDALDKRIAIEAIKHDQDVVEYATACKNAQYAKKFLVKIQAVLVPLYSSNEEE